MQTTGGSSSAQPTHATYILSRHRATTPSHMPNLSRATSEAAPGVTTRCSWRRHTQKKYICQHPHPYTPTHGTRSHPARSSGSPVEAAPRLTRLPARRRVRSPIVGRAVPRGSNDSRFGLRSPGGCIQHQHAHKRREGQHRRATQHTRRARAAKCATVGHHILRRTHQGTRTRSRSV